MRTKPEPDYGNVDAASNRDSAGWKRHPAAFLEFLNFAAEKERESKFSAAQP